MTLAVEAASSARQQLPRTARTEFVVASAQDAASRVIQEHETIALSRAEQIAFVSALLKPPAVNARLRQAAAAYRKQLGL